MCCYALCLSWVRFSVLVTLGLVLTASCNQASFGKQPTGPTVPSTMIPIEFPLSSAAEMRLTESLERIAITANGLDRPLVVLEFTKSKQAEWEASEIGRNTPFERALGLARWLSGPRGSRIRSVAYLPKTICGHAVLVALSCEEIAIASDAEIGKAGIDEPLQDSTIRQAYLDVAARRGAFPPAAVLSLLDSTESLVRVEFTDKNKPVEYITLTRLTERIAKQERTEDTADEIQMVPTNQMAFFSGQELRNWRWIAHTANDKDQLEQSLKLTKPMVSQALFEGERVAIRTHLTGIMSGRQVNRSIRAIEEGLTRAEVNLILLEIDSSGGNLVESLRLAQYLAEIPAERAEVVCFISDSALGDAALIPLACDTILMQPKAMLGGAGEATISQAVCRDYREQLQLLARTAARSEGELLSLICQDIPIFEYNSFDGRKQLANPDWLIDDPIVPQWVQGERVTFPEGVGFEKANELGLASESLSSLDAVGKRFGIETLPDEIRTNRTEQFVEWLAGQVWLSMLLFMVGIICLSAELSTPGIGVAGVLSGICFLLFFWIHLFQGTVEWLEILLILGGVVCLGIEMFVLPGFGVFGIAGLIMLGVGLLLAGQTFVIPTNNYQWQRTAQGIGQLGLITITLMGLAVLFRKQLAKLPMIRWFSLQPPMEDRELILFEQTKEDLRTFIGWNGMTVSRCNPSGKATVGDRVFQVTSSGDWIDEESPIEVVEVQDTTLVVKPRART
jgi:membrane-bound serine protease (ClpP class)